MATGQEGRQLHTDDRAMALPVSLRTTNNLWAMRGASSVLNTSPTENVPMYLV